jgi:uncharacterized protein (TIGR00251 family)
MTAITPTADGVRLELLVQPRASRSEIAGLVGDRIKIRLAAPPVEGQANDALIRLLADLFDLARSQVIIRSGESGRRKSVVIRGITPDQALNLLDLG